MFRGSMVALVTPMDAAGEVDWRAWQALLEFHLDNGTNGVVVAGTTGESPTVTPGELERLVRSAVELVDGRMAVIGGSGSHSTAHAIELTRLVQGAGADAALIVTPYYNKPTQTGLKAHYGAIADATSLPIILYNVPGRTCCDLLPETAAALSEIDQVVALKEAVPGAERVRRIRELCGENLQLLSGDDATAGEFMLAGGDGVISVTGNVAPALVRTLCEFATAGDAAAAGEVDARLAPLSAALFAEPSPIPVKWALWRMGLIGPGIRLPLTPLSPACQPAVETALAAAGIELPPVSP
jgi:4-hydroxy-tetrahydrodipicolinate synthase